MWLHHLIHPSLSLVVLFSPFVVQLAVKTVFVRGSVVRYVHVPQDAVDTELLQDAARREAMEAGKPAQQGGVSGGGGGVRR